MPLFGQLAGAVVSRGQSGANPAVGAPSNPPTILSFTLDDMTLDTGVAGTFSWTKSGTQTGAILDPGDGSGNYTLTTESSQAHTYDAEGVYDATLTLTGPGGTSTPATINDIVVTAATGDFFPSADDAIAYYTPGWADFTFTSKNFGPKTTYVPVRQRFMLDPGQLDPTTHEMYAELGGVEVPLQISERSFHGDGSLHWFTIHVLHEASWTVGTTKQWTVKKRSGALHAETDSRTVALVNATAGYDLWLDFTEVKRIIDSSTWGSGTYYAKLNDALALGHVRKTAAGPLYSEWEIEDMVREDDGASDDRDDYWYCRHIVGVYCRDGTDTVESLIYDPMVGSGFPNTTGPALWYKAALKNGASVIRDFAATFTCDAADIDATGNDVRTPTAGEDKIPIGGVVLSGDLPSGLSTGTLYPTRMADGGNNYGVGYYPVTFHTLSDKVNAINIGANGGGSFDVQLRIWMTPRQPWVARTAKGWPHHIVGESKALPAWTRTEKIDRFNRGICRPIDLDGTANAFDEAWNFHPTGFNFHKNFGDGPGDTYALGEPGGFFHCLILDMETENHHDQMARAASEALSWGEYQWLDGTTNGGTGAKYLNHFVINNGPNDSGVGYSGIGFTGTINKFGSYYRGSYNFNGVVSANSYSGENLTNCQHPSQGSNNGSHTDPSLSWYFVLYAHNQQMHAWAGEWINYALGTQQSYPPGVSNEVLGTDRLIGARRYYRVMTPAFAIGNNGPRGFTGVLRAMQVLQHFGSLRREYAYFQEHADDQETWFDEAMTNVDIIGDKAKLLGMPAALGAGGNQNWQLSRIANLVMDWLRQRGRWSPNMVRYLAQWPRGNWGDSIDGVNVRSHLPGGWVACTLAGIYIPNGYSHAFGDPGTEVYDLNPWHRTDDARFAQFEPWKTVMHLDVMGFVIKTTGNTITFTQNTTRFPAVIDGDFVHIMTTHGATLPAGWSKGTIYYLYDVTATEAKLSTTDPTVTITPFTWTTASDVTLASSTNSDQQISWSLGGPGAFGDGLSSTGTQTDYYGDISASVSIMLHYFGETASGCLTAFNNEQTVRALWKSHTGITGYQMEDGLYAKKFHKYQPT